MITTIYEQIHKQVLEIEKENIKRAQEIADEDISNLLIYLPRANKINREFKR